MLDPVSAIDACIRRDPGRRGLISSEPELGPLCPGDLAAASADLAGTGTSVAIVTGFFIPRGDPPAAETDGPPGALFLAGTLREAGLDTCVITDQYCRGAVRAAAEACDFPLGHVLCFAGEDDPHAFLRALPDLSHLVSIERVGPSHTLESLRAQRRAGEPPADEFLKTVPPEHQGRCHNMRGEYIDEYTAGTHRLFEALPDVFPTARTIGIGDGGNELGMGRIPWEDLARRLTGPQAAWLPCRIATDWTILAGTSNWGGYALAAATLLRRGQAELLEPWTASQQQAVVQHMVEAGPAVDGVTRRREATVDGLPFLTYIQPWVAIRGLLGLA